jgi:GT2 family glycosyltransferase
VSLAVVIPTHDTRELALRAVASVLREAGSWPGPVEIVVVDDGSRDGTAEALASAAPGVRVLRSEVASGFAAAANRGLAAAAGETLLLLNSDAALRAGALGALAAALAEDPQLGVAGAELYYPDGRRQWSGGREPSIAWFFGMASGLAPWSRALPGRRAGAAGHGGYGGRVDWVSGAAMALRREVWSRCGPLDEGYAFYCQDLDLCWAARRAGSAVRVVAGFAAVHHHGATIARRGEALAGQRLDLLWPDLVRCVEKYRGASFARGATVALRAGARLRLAARALGSPFAADRAGFAAESAALSSALAALRAGGR